MERSMAQYNEMKNELFAATYNGYCCLPSSRFSDLALPTCQLFLSLLFSAEKFPVFLLLYYTFYSN